MRSRSSRDAASLKPLIPSLTVRGPNASLPPYYAALTAPLSSQTPLTSAKVRHEQCEDVRRRRVQEGSSQRPISSTSSIAKEATGLTGTAKQTRNTSSIRPKHLDNAVLLDLAGDTQDTNANETMATAFYESDHCINVRPMCQHSQVSPCRMLHETFPIEARTSC